MTDSFARRYGFKLAGNVVNSASHLVVQAIVPRALGPRRLRGLRLSDKIFSRFVSTYAVEYYGEEARGVSWKAFWTRYKDMGGDGFYGACKVPYLEPAYRGLTVNGRSYGPGLCPVAEALQPLVMQFKTNYRDPDVAQLKTELLARLIDELGR